MGVSVPAHPARSRPRVAPVVEAAEELELASIGQMQPDFLQRLALRGLLLRLACAVVARQVESAVVAPRG